MKASPSLLVVGLGNPGAPYASHRHNVGFWVINRLARQWRVELKAGRLASVGQGEVAGSMTALAKPRTFVNRSGQAVAALLRRYSLPVEGLLVVCDDLDLPVGALRLRPQGGPGGHRGLESIIGVLGRQAFPRVRIGIGRPLVGGEPSTDPEVIAAYVLSPPPPPERRLLEEAVALAAEATAVVAAEGLEAAMNRYNQ